MANIDVSKGPIVITLSERGADFYGDLDALKKQMVDVLQRGKRVGAFDAGGADELMRILCRRDMPKRLK